MLEPLLLLSRGLLVGGQGAVSVALQPISGVCAI
jgi:hypothetical protein